MGNEPENWCKHNQNIAGKYERCLLCNPEKGSTMEKYRVGWYWYALGLISCIAFLAFSVSGWVLIFKHIILELV